MSEDKEAEEIAEALDKDGRKYLRRLCAGKSVSKAYCGAFRRDGLMTDLWLYKPTDLGRRVAAILRDRAIAAETKP